MLKLLIIDDDLRFTEMLKRFMSAHGFQVIIANSGLDGVQAACRIRPDVILLDLMMPEMSGWEVCKTIRSFSQVPILVLSAVMDSQQVMQILDHGANEYLLKPVPENMLVTYIERLGHQTHLI